MAIVRTSLAAFVLVSLLAGCAQMPSSGPWRRQIESALEEPGPIQLVEMDETVVRALAAQRRSWRFSEELGAAAAAGAGVIGAGDMIEVSIWEAPPATLFGSPATDLRAGITGTRAAVLPEQMVDAEGRISVPFAGQVPARGLKPQGVAEEIARRLRGKANQPEVVVRLTRNTSAMVTVVGEVTASTRMPLTPSGERLLDALAAAGGVRQPVNKMTVQVTRGTRAHSMPLDVVIRDPSQNVTLHAGDVVTALFQPLSFTALGATGRQTEVSFETQGINLSQALARAGGLDDSRSDSQGIFLFRLERADALPWKNKPVVTTADGRVPVVYRMTLRDPASFFVMQGFEMNDKDVLYVSNAPAAELQKFLNLVFSLVYPIANVYDVTR